MYLESEDMDHKAALRACRRICSESKNDLLIGIEDCEEERMFFDVIRDLASAVEALPEPPAPTTWACASCTFENPLDASDCEICDGPRVPVVPLAASATPSDLITCHECTLVQSSVNTVCEICRYHLRFI